MKKFIFGFLLLFIIFPSYAFAKDYSIKSVNFEVLLNSDGSADFIEERTYVFEGSFSWADEWIDLKTQCQYLTSGCTNFTLSNFAISETGTNSLPQSPNPPKFPKTR